MQYEEVGIGEKRVKKEKKEMVNMTSISRGRAIKECKERGLEGYPWNQRTDAELSVIVGKEVQGIAPNCVGRPQSRMRDIFRRMDAMKDARAIRLCEEGGE